MRGEEIAIRQEVRQMLAESGLNRNTLREMAEQTLKEQIEKQVKLAVQRIDVNAIVRHEMESYAGQSVLREAIRLEVRDRVKINVDVTAFDVRKQNDEGAEK